MGSFLGSDPQLVAFQFESEPNISAVLFDHAAQRSSWKSFLSKKEILNEIIRIYVSSVLEKTSGSVEKDMSR